MKQRDPSQQTQQQQQQHQQGQPGEQQQHEQGQQRKDQPQRKSRQQQDRRQQSSDQQQQPSTGKPQQMGEGSYEGTRDYNRRTEQYLKANDVKADAEAARPRSEQEARELKEAEREGRSHSKGEH